MNRFLFPGAFPATACSALATCSPIPPQGPPCPVGLVLVVDDLVPAAAVRPGRPWLGEDVPVGDLLAGVLAIPRVAVTEVARIGHTRRNYATNGCALARDLDSHKTQATEGCASADGGPVTRGAIEKENAERSPAWTLVVASLA